MSTKENSKSARCIIGHVCLLCTPGECLLYSRGLVQNDYCTAEVLHKVIIVQQRSCTKCLLYSRGLAQIDYCTAEVLHKVIIVQ